MRASAINPPVYMGGVLNEDVEGVIGSSFGDVLTSDDKNDILSGAGGNDILTANAGNDTLNGGDNDDQFVMGKFFSGADKRVEAWAVEHSPDWLTRLTTRY